MLKYKDKLIVKETEIKEFIDYIQTTDNELYNLAKRQSSALITDDIKFSRHVDGKIETQFSTFFLTLLVSSRHLSKEKALELLEKLRNIRNWRDNIIYLITKNNLNDISPVFSIIYPASQKFISLQNLFKNHNLYISIDIISFDIR